MSSLVPHVELPRYFTLTSKSRGKHEIELSLDAELVDGEPFHKDKIFQESKLTLEDLLSVFPFETDSLGTIARMFMRSVVLPRDCSLSAQRGSKTGTIDLVFELRGDKPRRWNKTFDTSQLNLQDLACLLEWAQEATKHSRH